MTNNRLLSIRETQERLGGMCRASIYKIINRDELKIRKIGSRSFIRLDDLNAYIDSLDAA